MAQSRDIRSPGTATSALSCSASFASRWAWTASRHCMQPARWRAARLAGPAVSSPSTSAAMASWARWLSGMRHGITTARGARWARASRSCTRPRWMRLRTVPSLMPRVAAISS